MPQSETIENIAFGAKGVLRHQGKAVFVPLTLKGERIEFEITESKKSYDFGRLTRVLEPSKDRIKPKCQHYAECGGCQLQHATYPAQLKMKQGFVLEALERIGKLESPIIEPIIGTDKQWNYRRRIKLHTQDGKTGFIGRDGKSLVEIKQCEIFSGEDLDLDPNIFIQAHPEQSEKLYQDLIYAISQYPKSKILDLYCGVGDLTAKLAKEGHEVTGIEVKKKTIKQAIHLHGEKVKWIVGNVDHLCEPYLKVFKPDIVLVNPPRTGLNKRVLFALTKHKPKRIFYTSCMPPTLARDLQKLIEAGYKVVKTQPYDLFPQTTHVETVVELCLS